MEFDSITQRNDFIESNMKLVADRVMILNSRNFNEDLYQVGLLALIRATDAFDENRGTKFSTYAVRCIDGQILNYKNNDSLIKPIKKTTGVDGRNNKKRYFERKQIIALESCEKNIFESRPEQYNEFEDDILTKILLDDIIKDLKPKEQKIIKLYTKDITRKKISKIVGVSYNQVGRIIKKVGDKFKQCLSA